MIEADGITDSLICAVLGVVSLQFKVQLYINFSQITRHPNSIITMEQPHQHGPQCRHGHGGQGHGHGQGGHGHNRPAEISAKQYFQKLHQIKQKNPQFYWMQVLGGNYFNKYCQGKGLDMVRALNCQIVTMLVAQAEMMFTCQWLPLYLRPFVSGLFLPLLFLLFFNFNVIFGVSGLDFTMLHLFSYLTILLYILTALRTPGILSTEQNKKTSQQAIKERQYLENPNANCVQCKILKVFRSFHCPICKVCISKFARHSLAFGGCIGSSNQLLAWGFFSCLAITQFLALSAFFQRTSYGLITNLMFYALNTYVCWISLVQSTTLWIMNFYFGLTQHQTRTWMASQYLMKVPERQFVNSVGKGLIYNLIESVYALANIPAYESQLKQNVDNPIQQQIPISGNKQFQKLIVGKVYLVNWSRAYFYLTPQIPTHPCRDKVIQIMKRDEPKMLQMYKLQKKFKQQILKQTQGQGLNEFQIQQRLGLKMQQHMMKNAQNMMPQMAQPTPEQQKTLQIQMLTHMSTQLSEREPLFAQKLKKLLQNLKQDKVTTIEVGMAMRQIQQQMMKKQMQAVMKQRQMASKSQKQKQARQQDQEQQLKKQEVPDEDL